MPFIALPPGAKSVVIAGMGGFGLEIADYLNMEASMGGLPVAGVLADFKDETLWSEIQLPYLGTITDFRAQEGQVVIAAVGFPEGRRSVLERLWRNGNETPVYFHGTCVISPSARIERGSIVCPFSIVNRATYLGQGSMLNVHCSVGHGARVGAFSVLCPYGALNGDAVIGAECFMGTRATIYPKTRIGDRCIVDSHTGVKMSAEDNQIISMRGNYMVNQRRI